MPGYSGNNCSSLLYENKQALMFDQETPATGVRSVAFQLRRERGNFYPFAASFELYFSGAPGTFEVDIQGADTDAPDHYVTLEKITAVTGVVARYDMVNVWPKYVSALVVAAPANAVTTTLQVTR